MMADRSMLTDEKEMALMGWWCYIDGYIVYMDDNNKVYDLFLQ